MRKRRGRRRVYGKIIDVKCWLEYKLFKNRRMIIFLKEY